MIETISSTSSRHAHDLSAPKRGVLINLLPIPFPLPFPIPRVGRGKGIAKACFPCPTATARASRLPNLPLSSQVQREGGWEIKQWWWDREKQKRQKMKNK